MKKNKRNVKKARESRSKKGDRDGLCTEQVRPR